MHDGVFMELVLILRTPITMTRIETENYMGLIE